jgi:acyl-CoA thioester hydrolase
LREAGLPYTELEARGVMLPVVEAHCQYHRPAHYDDLLDLQTTLHVEKARIHIAYRILRDDELLAEGYTRHVCMGADGKAQRPPPELTSLFAEDP